MKKILSVLLCLAMLLSLVACAEEAHEHTFSDSWQSDETHHWHQATCEHTEEVSNKEAHFDEDGDNMCDICGTRMPHEHTYKTEWAFNADEHYHMPNCGCNVTRPENWSDRAAHVDENNDSVCDVCTYDYDHEHKYSEDWTPTEGGHWHLPTCKHDVDGSDFEPHVDEKLHDGTEGVDGKCDICGGNTHDHTYEEEWTVENGFHFKKPTCGCQIEPGQRGACVDENEDKKCDVCGTDVTHIHTFAEEWTSDELYHWHTATCEGCEGLYDTKIEHDGFEEDGICDTCAHVVFKLFNVTVSAPDYVLIVDEEGNLVEIPVVKEGKKVEFYLAVPATSKLEKISVGEVDLTKPIGPIDKDGTEYYLFKITVYPTEDTVVDCVVNKLSSVEVAVTEIATIVTPGKYKKATYDITFTAEETGHYALLVSKATKDGEDASGVVEWTTVGTPGNTPYGQHYYIFEATAGQPVSLQLAYGEMSSETVDITYNILRVEETFILPYLQGEGYTMPGKLPITIKFAVPEPGLYLFTTQVGQPTWIIEGHPDGTVEPQYFNATYAGQEFTATFMLQEVQTLTYEFDWKLVNLSGSPQGALNVGSTDVNISVNAPAVYSFTAPYAGTFRFGSKDDQIQIQSYYDFHGNGNKGVYAMPEITLQAGESVNLILSPNPYAANVPTQDFVGQLIVEYKPAVIGGNPQLLPNTSWTYVADKTGDVTFTVPAGCQISIDGGKTWANGEITVWVDMGAELTLVAKGGDGGTIPVTITVTTYKQTLSQGTGSYTFIAGKAYTCSIEGAGMAGKSFKLSWTDPDIKVTYNGKVLSSGDTVENFSTRVSLQIEYNGTADVSITVEDVTEEPEEG